MAVYRDENLPQEPRKRQTIVFMEPTDILGCYKKDNRVWLDDDNICVVEYPPKDDNSPLLKDELFKKLEKEHKVSVNRVLVLSPYGDESNYEIVSDSNPESLFQAHVKEKYDRFLDICGNLGAEIVEIYDAVDENTNKKMGIKANGGIPGKSAGVGIETKAEETFGSRLIMRKAYSKPKKDIPVARQLLKKYNLEHDGDIKRFIDSVETTHLKEGYTELTVYGETRNILDIAAKIKYIAFNADGKFKSEIEKKNKRTVKIRVKFFPAT